MGVMAGAADDAVEVSMHARHELDERCQFSTRVPPPEVPCSMAKAVVR